MWQEGVMLDFVYGKVVQIPPGCESGGRWRWSIGFASYNMYNDFIPHVFGCHTHTCGKNVYYIDVVYLRYFIYFEKIHE